MERDGKIGEFNGIFLGFLVSGIGGDVLFRFGKIYDALGEVDVALGISELMAGIEDGIGEDEGGVVGKSDVFGCETHQAPGDIFRVLSAFDHSGQPIKRRVSIAATHGFVKS